MFRQFRSLAVAGLLAGSMLAVSTAAASAAPAPRPVPTPTATETINPNSEPTPCPTIRTFSPTGQQGADLRCPVPGPRDNCGVRIGVRAGVLGPDVRPTDQPTIEPRTICRPETFNVLENSLGTDHADAHGPVSGTGFDQNQSNTLDRFRLGGPDSVNVLHTGVPFPSVNLPACTASVIQLGAWAFNGGTGLDRFAIGHGLFVLVGLWHFPDIRGVCSLVFLRGNPLLQNRIRPDVWSVTVHGAGVAAR